MRVKGIPFRAVSEGLSGGAGSSCQIQRLKSRDQKVTWSGVSGEQGSQSCSAGNFSLCFVYRFCLSLAASWGSEGNFFLRAHTRSWPSPVLSQRTPRLEGGERGSAGDSGWPGFFTSKLASSLRPWLLMELTEVKLEKWCLAGWLLYSVPTHQLSWYSICLQCRRPRFDARSGRSAGEGTGYPVQCPWASLVAQLVKNPPAMWETWVRSLGSQRVRHNWAAFTFTPSSTYPSAQIGWLTHGF